MVLHPEPLGPLLLLHTLPQDLMCVCLQSLVHRTIFHWDLKSWNGWAAGAESQSVCKLISAPLHLSSLANDWRGNIKAHLFTSGQDNSELWLPLYNSPAGLATFPRT